jgi:hypothetical protein
MVYIDLGIDFLRILHIRCFNVSSKLGILGFSLANMCKQADIASNVTSPLVPKTDRCRRMPFAVNCMVPKLRAKPRKTPRSEP